MGDRREEILIQEHDKLVDDRGYPKDGSKLMLTYRPAALSAMDEYMKECAISFLKYVLEKMQGHSVDAAGNVEVKYNGEWITPETLFENFL